MRYVFDSNQIDAFVKKLHELEYNEAEDFVSMVMPGGLKFWRCSGFPMRSPYGA
jgi:hypothetical protein